MCWAMMLDALDTILSTVNATCILGIDAIGSYGDVSKCDYSLPSPIEAIPETSTIIPIPDDTMDVLGAKNNGIWLTVGIGVPVIISTFAWHCLYRHRCRRRRRQEQDEQEHIV